MKTERSDYSGGVYITLSSDELATAIDAYLVARNTISVGPRTISFQVQDSDERFVCSELKVTVYVDPSGRVIRKGKEV